MHSLWIGISNRGVERHGVWNILFYKKKLIEVLVSCLKRKKIDQCEFKSQELSLSLYVRPRANIPPTISCFAFIHIKASNLICLQLTTCGLRLTPRQSCHKWSWSHLWRLWQWLIDRSAVMFSLRCALYLGTWFFFIILVFGNVLELMLTSAGIEYRTF